MFISYIYGINHNVHTQYLFCRHSCDQRRKQQQQKATAISSKSQQPSAAQVEKVNTSKDSRIKSQCRNTATKGSGSSKKTTTINTILYVYMRTHVHTMNAHTNMYALTQTQPFTHALTRYTHM